MGEGIAKYQRIAFDFAKKDKYDGCRFEKVWNSYHVFYVYMKGKEGACTGFPAFILVDDDLNARYSDIEETFKFM